jgi:hypothetical protein
MVKPNRTRDLMINSLNKIKRVQACIDARGHVMTTDYEGMFSLKKSPLILLDMGLSLYVQSCTAWRFQVDFSLSHAGKCELRTKGRICLLLFL